MKQIDRIYRHLQKSPITSLQAFERYGVTRLSSIIYDLRKLDLNIIAKPFDVHNRYGDKCRVAKYYLVKGKK